MKLVSLVRLAMVAVFGLFVLANCGGDGGSSDNETTGQDTAAEGTTDNDVTPEGIDDKEVEGEVCQKACDGKQCGPDGCGGSCGVCTTGTCNVTTGLCEQCQPACDGKVCGPDGCGGFCGTLNGACPEGESCQADGTCKACQKQCNGKVCGPDGCGGNCGTCGAGTECNATGTECVAAAAPFGSKCGPTTDCQPPDQSLPQAEYEAAQQKYWDCLNAQCATELCFSPFCTKFCTISKDQNKDNIDDLSSPVNDCEGAVDGPVGGTFRCVNIAPQGYQPTGICYPGSDLKGCDKDADCPNGESCQVTYIGGAYESHCQTNVKGGTTEVAAECNDNPLEGDVSYCANGFCFTIGCSAFCAEDTDCLTSPGCEAGKCKNNPDLSCTTDKDCSAWSCRNLDLAGDGSWMDDVCFPKDCYKEKDCPDTDFFCRPFIADTQDKFTGSCMMKPEETVGFGEVCDENPDDNIPGPICVNPYMCIGGYCGGMCTVDGDCAEDKAQKCVTIFEYDYDIDEDGNADAYLPLWGCQTFPHGGTAEDCMVAGDCDAGASTDVCQVFEFGPAAGDLALGGQCVTRDDAKGNFADLCGTAVGVNCNSGFCMGADETNAGFCTETCLKQSDCLPATIEGTNYKSVCRSLLMGWNGTADRKDDIYLPLCLLTAGTDSLADCSADFTCAAENESCVPFVIAANPDQPGTVDWLCMGNGEADTLELGAECNPFPADDFTGPYCKTGLCLPGTVKGKGTCSKFCKVDDDCTGLGLCYAYPYIDRADDANDVYVNRCQQPATCVECSEDADCGPNYSCVNVGGLGFTVDYRCAPTCVADADCTGTDGGATCKDSKDKIGDLEGKKACIPANGTCK
jgi:hypothetical protein